jgi:hypothetical protein
MEPLIVVMDNRPFVVDREKAEFRQYDFPDNTIPLRAFARSASFYSVQLNGDHNSLPHYVLQEELSTWARFGINVKSRDDQWGIFLGDEILARRLAGELPYIDVLGTDFTVEWRLKELRETAKPWKNINLRDMHI